VLGLDVKQVENVMLDIQQKKRTTEYLRAHPYELDPTPALVCAK
jgi:hypothetical protein